MFRIRRIHDDFKDLQPALAKDLMELLTSHFPYFGTLSEDEFFTSFRQDTVSGLRRFQFIALQRSQLMGTALCLWAPKRNFVYLDYIATRVRGRRGGLGEALFQRVIDRARKLKARAIFLETRSPVQDGECDEKTKREDLKRIEFYERFGARRIVCDALRKPRSGVSWDLFYLELIPTASGTVPLNWLKDVVEVVLRDRNAPICDLPYRRSVLKELQHPVRFHAVNRRKAVAPPKFDIAIDEKIILVVSEDHQIHHVRDRGYSEVPIRIDKILGGVEALQLFERRPVKHFPDKWLSQVHNERYLSFLKKLHKEIPEGRSIYPECFTRARVSRPPKQLLSQIGYYALDSSTPLSKAAYLAARQAVNAALTAADSLVKGQRHAYALVRPPGHHSGRESFGGFCYLNSTAIAAHYLSESGRVAVLDLDFHHGNGQQEIFYDRSDVLTVSIHADPNFEYPYFQGFADERGDGPGEGFNLNMPLPASATPEKYLKTLDQALKRIREFNPKWMVLALGFDTAKRDPTGTWSLEAKHFAEIGRRLGAWSRPYLFVQEGGYRTRTLGTNARALFSAFGVESQS